MGRVAAGVRGDGRLSGTLALRREEESEAPIASRQDPIFGPFESFEDGVWLARACREGSWVPVAVEAGGEGPSKEQQDLYREFLKDPSSYRQALGDRGARFAGSRQPSRRDSPAPVATAHRYRTTLPA
ncbi:MAG: hypothetical protein R3E96_05605 [Planctomycetota bacterium]